MKINMILISPGRLRLGTDKFHLFLFHHGVSLQIIQHAFSIWNNGSKIKLKHAKKIC